MRRRRWAACERGDRRWLRPTPTRSATGPGTSSPARSSPTTRRSSCSASASRASRRSRSASRSRGMNIELSAKKVKLKELAVFSRQFATMVNSGLPILRALAILSEQTTNPTLAKVLTDVRACDVEQGASLSPAMREAPEGLQRPLHLDGEVGRDRRPARRRAPAPGRDARERGQAPRRRSSRP